MNLKTKSTLIVDDSRAMRDMLRIHLSNLGISQVRMAERISDALREIKERPFDIILCDYHLGDGRNGQQFLEELRSRDLIHLSEVFIMVTSEQKYTNVIAVAEYAPDDYLIKPFVSNALEQRISAAFEKKDALRAIFSAMDAKDFKKAFEECQNYLLQGVNRYRKYVERLRAECCLRGENYEYAAHYYEEILAERPVAWAELGLGKALHHIGEFERATHLISHVCQNNPMYLESYDSLAKVHEAAGEDVAAEAVIDRAIEKSPLRLDRHSRLGEVALRNGNLDKAEKAFAKIVSDGVGSCYHSPEAYFRLAEIHVAKGDTKMASEVLSKISGHFENTPDAEFCMAVAEIGVARKTNDSDKISQAFEAAKKVIDENPEFIFPENARLRFGCEALEIDCDTLGEGILRNIFQNSPRQDAVKKAALNYVSSPESSAKLQLLFKEFNNEVDSLNERSQALARKKEWDEAVKLATEAVTRLKNNIDVLLSAAQINLMRMDHTGWDEIRFPVVRKYLERARNINPKHSKLAAIEMLVERIKGKYGIKTEKRKHYVPSEMVKASPNQSEKIPDGLFDEMSGDQEINLDELL